jgi:hypothetical protein
MAQTQVGPQCTIQYAAAEDARKALFFTGTNLGSRAIIVTPIAVKPPPIPLTVWLVLLMFNFRVGIVYMFRDAAQP